MQNRLRGLPLLLVVLIAIGTLAGLMAAAGRFRVESHNRRVEIGVEYAEADALAQTSGHPLAGILRDFKAQNVSALIIMEDTPGVLELTGAVRPTREPLPDGRFYTLVEVDSAATLERIRTALQAHGVREIPTSAAQEVPIELAGGTRFRVSREVDSQQRAGSIDVGVDYSHLRTLGLGLPPEAVQTARAAGMEIVGRIANFAGVTPASARAVLANLRAQGASLVIFTGDDVLGYRGLEKSVAEALAPAGLTYGEVEFGKQKGDAQLSSLLHGDYVRVHSIQVAEMGQMDEGAMIDRYALAARERNIRFCYVRLLTFAGADAVTQNVQFLKKISLRIAHGSMATAGGLDFGAARPFETTGVPTLLFGVIALGVAAGMVWMLRELCPLPNRAAWLILGAALILCVGLALSGQSGRAVVALLAGIAYPAIACLRAFPHVEDGQSSPLSLRPGDSLNRALRSLAAASAVTAIGVVLVVGLLATREFIVKASQFLGIKAQHGVPILIIAFVALVGGVSLPGETWAQYRNRVSSHLRRALDEPARYGIMLVGIVALVALVVILARTGNDSGVGASTLELKFRALMDRILPVRPRTKEFLVGHPAFVLALAWWWRGRRRLAIPCFVVGSIGQVSLLNTFCHIHTPLIASLWRGGLGLVVGALLGGALFLALERLLPAPSRIAVVDSDGLDLREERAAEKGIVAGPAPR